MPILPAPEQLKFHSTKEFRNDFANVEVMDIDNMPLQAHFERGTIQKVILEDQFGKTTLVFKPYVPDDAAQLKELEYALSRYIAELNLDSVDIRPLNHETLFVKWPRLKGINDGLLVKKGEKVMQWTPQDLDAALEKPDFKFNTITVNIGCYLRKMQKGYQAGLYFTLNNICLPADTTKKFGGRKY